jgi:hypothetical protein
VSGDRPSSHVARARERAVVIRQAGLLPARLRVAQKVVVLIERELYGASTAVLVERLPGVPNALGSVI